VLARRSAIDGGVFVPPLIPDLVSGARLDPFDHDLESRAKERHWLWCVLDNLMTHFYDRRVENNQKTVIRAANVISVSPYLTRLSWSILRSYANLVTVYAGAASDIDLTREIDSHAMASSVGVADEERAGGHRW
jgi:hypothetical protein